MDETSPVYQNFLNKMRFSRPLRESTRKVSASKFLQRDDNVGEKMSMSSTVRDVNQKINDITVLVVSIHGTLKAQEKLNLDILKFERERIERRRRRNRERDLESRKGSKNIFQKLVDKATAPIRGLLSTVLGGLFNILTGKFVMGLIDFFTKPKNIERLVSVLKFLGDYLPAIATISALLIATIGGTIAAMSLKFIPALIGTTATMLSNPKVLAAAGLVTAGGFLLNRANSGETTKVTEDDTAVTSFAKQGGAAGFLNRNMFGGGDDNNMDSGTNVNVQFSGGGKVPGTGNADSVPSMLTPGEFVMSKGAVEKFGTGTLSAMNAMGGGTNVPIINLGGTKIAMKGGGEVTDNMIANINIPEISPPMRASNNTMVTGTNNTFNMPTQTDAITNTAVLPTFTEEAPSFSKMDVLGIKYKEFA